MDRDRGESPPPHLLKLSVLMRSAGSAYVRFPPKADVRIIGNSS